MLPHSAINAAGKGDETVSLRLGHANVDCPRRGAPQLVQIIKVGSRSEGSYSNIVLLVVQ